MNNLIVNNQRILIQTQDPQIIDVLKKEFTYVNDLDCMKSGCFDRNKIKKVCFLKKIKQYHWLYKGFLYDLLLIIKKNKWEFALTDQREKLDYKIPSIEEIENILPGKKLRDYQAEAALSVLKNKNGIIKLATATGKTTIFSAILKYLNRPFLVLVNKKSLANQIWKELNEEGVDCGVLHSEKKIFKDSMVSTVQSAYKIPTLDKVKILILDEVHNGNSETFQEFLSKVGYPIMFGLSATPEKHPYKFATIRQFFGNIIYTQPTSKMIEDGNLTKPYIYFIENTVSKEIDWQTSEKVCIINNSKRNKIIKDFVEKHPDRHFLIIIDKLDHGYILRDLIKDSVFIEGDTKQKDRDIHKKSMEDGVLKVIIASRVFLEGISINKVDCLINAAGMKSEANTIQKGGRALRLSPGKEKAIILEFLDKGNKILMNQAMSRFRSYKKEGYEEIERISQIDLLDKNIF